MFLLSQDRFTDALNFSVFIVSVLLYCVVCFCVLLKTEKLFNSEKRVRLVLSPLKKEKTPKQNRFLEGINSIVLLYIKWGVRFFSL